LAEKEYPEILVYRRTHTGDPNNDGVFGCHDCMGNVRDISYDAVIGIGGSKPDPGDKGIKERITWIGIGPDPINPTKDIKNLERFRGQLITFDKFIFLNENDDLSSVEYAAPRLYTYMFEEGRIPRYAKNFPPEIYAELKKILKLADQAPPSPARDTSRKSISVISKCSSSDTSQKSRGCK
jgi:hypothetical protein